MATPRKVSVAVTIGLGAGPVDVTNDLVAFTFEENAQLVGETLDIVLDNASGYYTTIWWIEKGTHLTISGGSQFAIRVRTT